MAEGKSRESTTIRLDSALRQRVKVQAAKEGRSVKALVEDVLSQYLKRKGA